MKIEKTNVENHEATIVVSVEADEFAPAMNKAAKKIASSQRIPGFRPGKAPISVIRNMFGELAIAQEAFDLFLEDKYSAILTEAGVEPGAMGRLEKVDAVNPPVFTLVVPMAATVKLGDYRSIREEYVSEDVTEEELVNTILEIKKPYATQEPSEEPVADGNAVYVKIKGTLDEPLEEGGTTELVKEMDHEFVIGSDSADPDSAWPYPAYTQCLIGAHEGDTVISEYVYPKDSPIVSLRGKKATFETTIESVKKLVLPEEDAELAKNYGDYESWDAFLEDVKKRLQESKNYENDKKYVDKLLTKLEELAEVEYSPAELQEEIDYRVNELKGQIAQRGVDLDTWLKMQKKTLESYVEEEIKPVAEQQLKRRLVLQQFAQEENVQMDLEKFKGAVDMLTMNSAAYLASLKTKKQRTEAQNRIMNQAMNETYSAAILDRLKAIAKGEEPSSEDPAEVNAKAAAAAAAEITEEAEASDSADPAEEAPAE